ncbi:MAG TPA: DUF1844 domain-containing protein [Thermoanaerobaculia bacterium]|nr:DUF1844 domain-containing protein [Thermoanaerobaculia bacterium]
MSEGEDKPIRVVDRRMFTPEGDLRPDFEPEEPAPEPAKPAQAPARAESRATSEAPPSSPGPPTQDDAEPAPAAGEPRSEFARIVSSLATTAYSALGLLADPSTGVRHRDLAVARQMIDWLAILEQKTRGNLSFEESDLLSRVLYELRLAYVEVGRAPK